MNKNKLKFGLVGTGRRGVNAFGKMLCGLDSVELAAFCDLNPVRMKCAAAKLGIAPAYYSSVTDMVHTEKLDAAVITTPDACHEENAVAALRAGADVLIDKPLATTVKGCRRIIEAARATGKTVMIGFNLRHNNVLQKLKQLIDAGTLGDIFLMENREFYPGGRTYMSRWNRNSANSGGLWVHKGSHDFDVFQWLLGFPRPVKVSAFAAVSVFRADKLPFALDGTNRPGPRCRDCFYREKCPDVYRVDDIRNGLWSDAAAAVDGYQIDLCMYASDKDTHDNGIALVEYDNGVRASHLECFATAVEDRRYTIVGSRGQAEASLAERQIRVYPRWTGEVITYRLPREDGGHGGADPKLLETFITVVRNRLPSPSSCEQGLWATATGQAAEISRNENRTVMIRELL